ncbi:MAG: hypothetical protein KGJ53_04235 [Alphaproteobacteria bacterium]|nr:hypothetical protein [Alphaproteobacteria bacterium]
MKHTKTNPPRGSTFESYLAEAGLLKEATATARKRVLAWQNAQATKRSAAKPAKSGMRSFEAFKRKMLKNPAFKAEYDALEPEFALLRKKIAARAAAKRKRAAGP